MLTSTYSFFADYDEKTKRDIPVVPLERVEV